MSRLILLWPSIILIGFIFAFSSVLVGSSGDGYGFPLAWKTGGCAPPGIEISVPCFLAIGRDWTSFGLDVLFYMAIGYLLLFVYTRYHPRRTLD